MVPYFKLLSDGNRINNSRTIRLKKKKQCMNISELSDKRDYNMRHSHFHTKRKRKSRIKKKFYHNDFVC